MLITSLPHYGKVMQYISSLSIIFTIFNVGPAESRIKDPAIVIRER